MHSPKVLVIVVLLGLSASGCQLVTRFDRSKLGKVDGSKPSDAGFDTGESDAALDGAIDAEVESGVDGGQSCADDDACDDTQFCDENFACVPRLDNNGDAGCGRDRQCSEGGGCCDYRCIWLNQDKFCGLSGCGVDCSVLASGKACIAGSAPRCGCNVDSACSNAEYCDLDAERTATYQTCQPKLSDDASCSRNRQCASGGCCDTTNTCVAFGKNISCGIAGSDDGYACATDCTAANNANGAICRGGICGCNYDTDCLADRYCDASNHQCIPKKFTGSACIRNRQCSSGGCCNTTKTCVALNQNYSCGIAGGDQEYTCATDCTNGDGGHTCRNGVCE